MNNPISTVDPGGLLEYSVVFTDRSLNHMSRSFQAVMNDISETLKKVYGAEAVAVVEDAHRAWGEQSNQLRCECGHWPP